MCWGHRHCGERSWTCITTGMRGQTDTWTNPENCRNGELTAVSTGVLPGLSTWPGACLLHSLCHRPGSAWLVPVPSSVVSETHWLPSFSSHSQLSDVQSLSLSCASPLLLLSVSLSWPLSGTPAPRTQKQWTRENWGAETEPVRGNRPVMEATQSEPPFCWLWPRRLMSKPRSELCTRSSPLNQHEILRSRYPEFSDNKQLYATATFCFVKQNSCDHLWLNKDELQLERAASNVLYTSSKFQTNQLECLHFNWRHPTWR